MTDARISLGNIQNLSSQTKQRKMSLNNIISLNVKKLHQITNQTWEFLPNLHCKDRKKKLIIEICTCLFVIVPLFS